MNNIVRIILYIVGITLLYLWVSTAMEGCSKQKAKELAAEVETAKEVIDADQYFEEDEFEGGQTIDLSDDDSFETEGTTTDYTALDEAIDKTFEEAAPKATPQKPAPKPAQTTTRTSSNSSGKHMVIAGNFGQENNADKMVRKLINMGYSAEKVVFNNSQYHSVLAARSNDYSTVSNVSNELKRNGIDNYIKTQK